MSLATHRLLNAIVPRPLRTLGRRGALRFIPSMRHTDMASRLQQLARLGVAPAVILDVGAAAGDWSRMAHAIWPAARIVGVEPNAHQADALARVRADVPGSDFIRGFLGPAARTVRYANAGQQTSLLTTPDAAPNDEAPMFALDDLLDAGRLPQPQFAKLDVQGYELEVLRGGPRVLAGVEAVLIEVSFARLVPAMPLADEVVAFLGERGFALYDIVSMLRGPRTDRLLQADYLFLRAGHRLLADAWE